MAGLHSCPDSWSQGSRLAYSPRCRSNLLYQYATLTRRPIQWCSSGISDSWAVQTQKPSGIVHRKSVPCIKVRKNLWRLIILAHIEAISAIANITALKPTIPPMYLESAMNGCWIPITGCWAPTCRSCPLRRHRSSHTDFHWEHS